MMLFPASIISSSQHQNSGLNQLFMDFIGEFLRYWQK